LKKKEMIPAWLIALAATFTLGGYEFVRSPSNSLFMKFYGKEGLPLIQSIMPVGVILIIYLYTRILSWVGPRKTLFITTLGSASLIVGSYFAIECGIKPAAGFLYILREAYSVLIIEQYWSFLNSFLEEPMAKKMNGPICGVASIGAIVCGLIVSQSAVHLGSGVMLLFAAVACVPAAFLSDYAYRLAGPRVRLTPGLSSNKKDHLGLHLFREEPALLRLLLIILATQVVSAVSGLAFQGELYDSLKDVDKQTAWQGGFYAAVNGFSALFQFVLSPLCLSFFPLGLVHLLIPNIQRLEHS
jgi:ATP/ADP translocase